jgi:hypothetical protein
MLKNKYFYLIGIIAVGAFILFSSKSYAGCCTTTDTGNCGDSFCAAGLCWDCGWPFTCRVFGPCKSYERLKVNYVGTCNGEYYSCPWSGVYPYCVCDKSCGATCCSNSDCGECGDCIFGSSSTYCTTNSSKCPATDTDGGKDYFTKGTCSYRYCNSGYSCAVSGSITDSCVGDTLYEYFPGSSSGPNYCGYETKNCNDYDCTTGLASACSISGSSLTRNGDDYSCSNGACAKVGTKTCESYTCSASNQCGIQSCAGTNYKCYRSNAGSWVWGTSAESKETACTDGYDNDCDGKVDSDDPDCPVSITVTSSPTGSGFVSVDNTPITTPQTFLWQRGSTHTLSASSKVQPSCCPALNFTFSSWSDGGAQTHTITTPSSSTTYTANFDSYVYLNVIANPSSGGTVTGSGWYKFGTIATISATPNTGYSFSSWFANWDGGYSGTANPTTVSMDIRAFTFAANGNTPTETASFSPSGMYTVTVNAKQTCGTPMNGLPISYSYDTTSGSDSTPFTLSVSSGTSLTLTAPNPGSASGWRNLQFHHWEQDGSNIGTSTSVTKTITASTIFTAVYVQPTVDGGNHDYTTTVYVRDYDTNALISSASVRLQASGSGVDVTKTTDGGYVTFNSGAMDATISASKSGYSDTGDPNKPSSRSISITGSNSYTLYLKSSAGICDYVVSINPSSGTYSDTTNTWTVSATDSSNANCPSSITYSISYSTSGNCDSSNTYVSPTSFSITRGGTLSNAFSVKVTRTDSSCTLTLNIKDPNGNIKATGSYEVSTVPPQACSPGETQACGNCGTRTCQADGTWGPCQPDASKCTGDCDVCISTDGGLNYNCAGDNSLCSGTASSCYCSGSGNSFNCQACPSSGCCEATCIAHTCGLSPNNARCSEGEICRNDCTCEKVFEAWLGVDNKINMTLGQTFPVSIYVKNKRNVKDSYSFSVSSSSNVQTKLWDSRISDVLPDSVVSTKVDIKPLISQQETITIKVTSDSGASKELRLEIKVGSSNMSDIDAFSIILVIITCCLILVKKLNF